MSLAEPLRTRRLAPREAERREVEGCLARWGLLRRPHPLGGLPVAAEAFGRCLRGALAELGPVFSAFGLYLASRIDLLAAADCLELSAIPDRVPPMLLAEVRGLVAVELGQPAEAILAALEPEPRASRLLVQVHRARLVDGQRVVLQLARPEATATLERDLPRLPLLAGAFAVQGWSGALLDDAIAEFQSSLREGSDFGAAAEALALLAVDAESFGLMVAPAVRRDLTTARLLTVEDPGGLDLASASAVVLGAAWDPARRRHELARLISVAWLRQALLGRVFPLELREAEVRMLESGRAAFLAGAFARPPAADRANLRGFLIALASHEPDEACFLLLREMTCGPEASEEALRLQVRQIVPFRDGAWSASGQSLAEHVFVCARQARACGFRPRLQLVAFYRGLASLAATVRQLAPDGDTLLDALQEVRVLSSLSQVREAMSPEWSEQWGRYAMLMSELPRKMDELLTLAAEGGVRRPPPETSRRPRREEGSHLVVAAGLMVMSGLGLLLRPLAQTVAFAARGEAVAAALFLAVGGILLWSFTRKE
ncbi:MAG: ubiquinone biosynthesis protein [Acidobacteriota bacterium]|jgi:ubiquinone biosynthesis protein|nr:ubiquinone biosynthesis protein [Acidobacteriota bacterium]